MNQEDRAALANCNMEGISTRDAARWLLIVFSLFLLTFALTASPATAFKNRPLLAEADLPDGGIPSAIALAETSHHLFVAEDREIVTPSKSSPTPRSAASSWK
jgi:hypothetical protein